MPRRSRLQLCELCGAPLHIVQRGNNRSPCFFADEDCLFYRHWLRLLAARHHCANYVHLLLTPERPEGASALMQALGRRYVQYVIRLYRRNGTLWEGRFKASAVQAEAYLLTCHRYIELNPVRAGMVAHPRDYRWSSYRHHAMEVADETISDHALYLSLYADAGRRARAYEAPFRSELDEDTLSDIRTASRCGGMLGTERFREAIEFASGERRARGKAGRPKRDGGGIDGEQIDLGF